MLQIIALGEFKKNRGKHGGTISMEGLYLPGFLLHLKWYNYKQELGIQSVLLELNGNAIGKETSARVLGCLM